MPAQADPAGRGERRGRLREGVVEALRRRIADGTLAAGHKLPTEQGLVREFAVSRTVIREAVAELRARGLVEPRQGSGVFVLPARPVLEGLITTGTDFTRLPEILELLEFRQAFEIEGVGLAATRRSPRQQAEIRAAHEAMLAAPGDGNAAVDADFAFHARIADATNNQFYAEVVQFLGKRTIPRSRLRPADGGTDYLRKIGAEHAAILRAIEAGDPDGARAAMRAHLGESQRRYQRQAHSGGEP